MTKILMRWFSVTGGKLVGKTFCAYPVYGTTKIGIRNGSIPCFNSPQWLAKSANCRGWIKNYLSIMQPIHHPVQWMMSPIANVDSNSPKFGYKYSMTRITFHVIRGLIEIADPWNVIFTLPSYFVRNKLGFCV